MLAHLTLERLASCSLLVGCGHSHKVRKGDITGRKPQVPVDARAGPEARFTLKLVFLPPALLFLQELRP